MWPAGRKDREIMWACCCVEGNIIVVGRGPLMAGKTRSCGCFQSESSRIRATRHGMHGTPEHRAYKCAKQRCEDPNKDNYPYYGGRGIEFRFKSFEQFFAELGKKPTPQHTVDRIRNDGHYEPGNVRWATRSEQAKNKRACGPMRHLKSICKHGHEMTGSNVGFIARNRPGKKPQQERVCVTCRKNQAEQRRNRLGQSS